ncbi:MAG: BrnA antitoxin family protein [bacterium]
MENKAKTSKSKQDIPEIPTNAELKPLHHRPTKGARLPKEEVKIRIEKHIIAWFRLKAQDQKCDFDGFINEALRQYIIQKIGDPEIRAGGLNSAQRAEVQAIVHEILASEIESQHAEMN